VLAGAAILLGVASCAPVSSRIPAVSETLPDKLLDPGHLVAKLVARDRELRSLRALATVDYRSWAGRGRLLEAVLVDRPKRLRLETLSGLGAVLIVTVAEDEIVGFHPREGLIYRGRSSKENLARYTQIPLELDEVTRLLLGLPPVNLNDRWEAGRNSASWERDGGRRETVFFDPARAAPLRWERYLASGEIELRADFSEYADTAVGPFPMKLSLEVPAQRLHLEIRYEQPELNATMPRSAFVQEKPASVREMPLESFGG
jgi:hypothetical protein